MFASVNSLCSVTGGLRSPVHIHECASRQGMITFGGLFKDTPFLVIVSRPSRASPWKGSFGETKPDALATFDRPRIKDGTHLLRAIGPAMPPQHLSHLSFPGLLEQRPHPSPSSFLHAKGASFLLFTSRMSSKFCESSTQAGTNLSLPGDALEKTPHLTEVNAHPRWRRLLSLCLDLTFELMRAP